MDLPHRNQARLARRETDRQEARMVMTPSQPKPQSIPKPLRTMRQDATKKMYTMNSARIESNSSARSIGQV